jgi:tRNA G18 (ribose-2'-O)-methylase SpoU
LVVRRLLASRFPVRSLLVTPQGLERLSDAAALLPESTPVFVADTNLMGAIVGFPFHRGILACGQRLAPAPIGDLLKSARTLVILEDLANADNVGAVFRNTGALAGADAAVLLSPGCCDPLYRKSLRVSMGQALRVPFAKLDQWPESLDQVGKAGFELLALTPDPAAQDINGFRPTHRVAMLLGAEGPGLTDAAFGRARARVRIPMDAGADSLNVATAGAIALAILVRNGTPV